MTFMESDSKLMNKDYPNESSTRHHRDPSSSTDNRDWFEMGKISQNTATDFMYKRAMSRLPDQQVAENFPSNFTSVNKVS